ncbi:MAG: hypothetical protein ACM3X6_10075, partial [Patescibacteria group bacterium]
MRPSETWARKIDTPAAAPKAFRGFLPEAAAGAFPYTIYAPADRWGFRKVHPKLVALLESGVLWLELGREGVSRRIVPFTDVAWVEMGRILLHAWLRIALFHGEGVTRLELEFNSVVEGLFRRLAEAIRAAAARIPPAGAEALRQERDRLAFLYGVNHKFANFAKGSLIPGERALAAHFEPVARRGRACPGRVYARPGRGLQAADRAARNEAEDAAVILMGS